MKAKKILLYVVPPVAAIVVIYLINRQSIKKKNEGAVKNSPLPEPPATTTQTAPAISLFPLKKGSNNDKVKDLQRILGITADGIFGSQTESSLKSFSGKTTVDSQAELDALSAKKATQQNQAGSISRAQDLLKQFQSGGLNIFAQSDSLVYGYTQDYAGAINYNNKNFTLYKGKTYNNSDYKLIGSTKSGNLQLQVSKGDLAGTYIVNPNSITLVR